MMLGRLPAVANRCGPPWLIAAVLTLFQQTTPLTGPFALAQAQDAPPPRRMVTEVDPGLSSPLATLGLDDLSATRERPLFAPSRRPPLPPPPPLAAPAAAPPLPLPAPNLAVVGIVGDQQGAMAIVRAGAADHVVRVRPGDEIAGWKVARIAERRLVLELGDRSVTFSLFAPAAGRWPAAGAAATDAAVEHQDQDRERLKARVRRSSR
jgi:general secretion pathway protein N